MPYILGLDTGGTYTDGVLVDVHSERVMAKAKALTTRHDLRIGIEACIDALDIEDCSEIKMVALSTTLATNAVVENRGGKTGLILIGQKRRDEIPTEYVEIIDGKMDIKGNIILPVSEEQAKSAVLRLKNKVDAIAISAYASVRNPQEELKVKQIVEKNTVLPVFCAHELSGSLGYVERTTTAVLNASLIGIIREFITATKESLRSRNINTEIMIVKSDGSLMREEVALKRPIDTILSGPAASAIGARKLTGLDNALVLDMGGTTVDVADISNGQIITGDECATVAGWRTKVHAVEISTHGIGGDSLISIDTDGNLKVGPQKAEPISRISYYYDNIYSEINEIMNDTSLSRIEKEFMSRCYCLINGNHIYNGDEIHDMVVELLKDKPHSMAFLMRKTGCDIESLMEKMLQDKEINVVDITPTDLLHILGRYEQWNREAAVVRSRIIAAAMDIKQDEFVSKAEQAVYKRIYISCIQAIADFEQENTDMYNDRAARYLIDKLFDGSSSEFLHAGCKLNKPLIAVGAPVRAWMPYICDKMNAEMILPEGAEVANAIGSAFGEVNEFAEALIRKEKGKRKYDLHLPAEKKSFSTRKAALEEAERALHELVMQKSRLSGCSEPEVSVESRDLYMKSLGERGKRYIETRVKAHAKGRPDCWKG